MIKFLTNNFPLINLYKKPSTKSEIVTQMIYGENFSIQKKTSYNFFAKMDGDDISKKNRIMQPLSFFRLKIIFKITD